MYDIYKNREKIGEAKTAGAAYVLISQKRAADEKKPKKNNKKVEYTLKERR